MLACQRPLGSFPRARWRIDGQGMEDQGDEVTGLLVSIRRLVNGAEWDEDLGFTWPSTCSLPIFSTVPLCTSIHSTETVPRSVTSSNSSAHVGRLKRTEARLRRCPAAPQDMNLLHSRAVSTRYRRCAMREIHAIAGGTYYGEIRIDTARPRMTIAWRLAEEETRAGVRCAD